MDELSSVAREMVRLIETATAPIFAVDVDGCINGWNAKVAELTGLSVEEAMGKSLVRDLIYKEYEETVDKLLSRALRGSRFTHNVFVPANFKSLIRGLYWHPVEMFWSSSFCIASKGTKRTIDLKIITKNEFFADNKSCKYVALILIFFLNLKCMLWIRFKARSCSLSLRML